MTPVEQAPETYIPHRPPVACLDAVLFVDQSRALTRRTIVGEAVLGGRIWEPWLIEGLAQTAAVLNGNNEMKIGRRSAKGMLVGIRNLRIHRRPELGETIQFEVELVKRISPLTLIEGRARVGDEEIAAGQMKFYVELVS